MHLVGSRGGGRQCGLEPGKAGVDRMTETCPRASPPLAGRPSRVPWWHRLPRQKQERAGATPAAFSTSLLIVPVFSSLFLYLLMFHWPRSQDQVQILVSEKYTLSVEGAAANLWPFSVISRSQDNTFVVLNNLLILITEIRMQILNFGCF